MFILSHYSLFFELNGFLLLLDSRTVRMLLWRASSPYTCEIKWLICFFVCLFVCLFILCIVLDFIKNFQPFGKPLTIASLLARRFGYGRGRQGRHRAQARWLPGRPRRRRNPFNSKKGYNVKE